MPKPLVNRARRLYGAHPLHLLLILGSFVVVGYALWLLGFKALWNPDTWWQSIAVWFVGAALVHDLLLFPAYAAADRILVSVSNRRWRSARGGGRVRVINFVRVPLLACGLISLMFFPGIIEQSGGTYNRATGQTQEPFLDRWLILCSLILLLGLAAYLIARMVAGRRSHTDDEPPAGLAEETSQRATSRRQATGHNREDVDGCGVHGRDPRDDRCTPTTPETPHAHEVGANTARWWALDISTATGQSRSRASMSTDAQR